jgi:hypothetical protein
LTTNTTSSTSQNACLAPAGSYMEKGTQGRLCPKGTYSEGNNKNVACPACPDGTTTLKEGSTSILACNRSIPGYQMIGPTQAELCPLSYYNDKEAGNCTLCPNGFMTQLMGSTGIADCLVPPGWELKPAAAAITPCAVGWYKEGWNRVPCVRCGDNLFTEAIGSVSKDDCLVPAGWGLKSYVPILVAELCVRNKYGDPKARAALRDAVCFECRPNLYTVDFLTNTNLTEG